MSRVSHKGFTLVELITVIVILGILSVFIVPRFMDTAVFRESAAGSEIISAARYAQQLAMARGSNHRLVIGANSYHVERNDGTPVTHPDGSGNYNVTVNSVTLITATPTIVFNPLGQASFFDAGGNPVAATSTTINGNSFTVTIERETGYAHR